MLRQISPSALYQLYSKFRACKKVDVMATAKQLREYHELQSRNETARKMAEERSVQKHASISPNQPAVTITEVCAGNGCQILITVRRKLCETELDFLKDDIGEKVKAFFDTEG